MIISTKSIYDKTGRKIGEVAACDQYKPKPPRWMLRDFVLGIFAALILATQIFD